MKKKHNEIRDLRTERGEAEKALYNILYTLQSLR